MARDQSLLDWPSIFESIDTIKQELVDYFPYKIIDVEGAEADDVIAVIASHFVQYSNVIVSSDKDFVQLHPLGIKQYSPKHKTWITHADPKLFLIEHIMKGDSTDGIPNVRSPDSFFVDQSSKKQMPITKLMINQAMEGVISDAVHLRNFNRNQQLIDLSFVPSDISAQIIEQYNAQTNNRPINKIYDYMIKYKLRNLMLDLSDFKEGTNETTAISHTKAS